MDALKKFRADKNLTQQQLAEMLGVSQSLIAHLEAGIRTITPKRAVEWERRTNGELSRTALRPDLWKSA